MWRFRDVTIKTKLFSLVVLVCSVLALVLGLAAYLLAVYRVNGPVYQTITQDKDLLAELIPATFRLTMPYVILQELETTTDAEEIKAQTKRFKELEAQFLRSRADWLKKMTNDEFRQGIETTVYEPAAE